MYVKKKIIKYIQDMMAQLLVYSVQTYSPATPLRPTYYINATIHNVYQGVVYAEYIVLLINNITRQSGKYVDCSINKQAIHTILS